MTVTRLAISLDQELARNARRAAGKQPVSAWIAEAIARRLRSEGLGRLVDEWERKHGVLSEDALAAADWTRLEKEIPATKRKRR